MDAVEIDREIERLRTVKFSMEAEEARQRELRARQQALARGKHLSELIRRWNRVERTHASLGMEILKELIATGCTVPGFLPEGSQPMAEPPPGSPQHVWDGWKRAHDLYWVKQYARLNREIVNLIPGPNIEIDMGGE